MVHGSQPKNRDTLKILEALSLVHGSWITREIEKNRFQNFRKEKLITWVRGSQITAQNKGREDFLWIVRRQK